MPKESKKFSERNGFVVLSHNNNQLNSFKKSHRIFKSLIFKKIIVYNSNNQTIQIQNSLFKFYYFCKDSIKFPGTFIC